MIDLRIDKLRIDNSGNIVNSFDCKVVGRDNYIGFRSNNSIVSGHDNTIQDDCINSLISGGHNNTIESGCDNCTIVGGSGYTITESNTSIVNGVKIKEGNMIPIIVNFMTSLGNVAYDAMSTDDVILFDATFSNGQIFLPSPGVIKKIEITKVSSTNKVTIEGNGFNINGKTNLALLSQYDSIELLFTGNEYIVN